MDVYKELRTKGQLYAFRGPDGCDVPNSAENTDYRIMQAAVSAGTATIQPADPEPIVFGGKALLTRTVRTVGVTPAELLHITIPALTMHVACLYIEGVDSGNGNARYIEARVVIKRLGAGAVIINNAGGQPYTLIADHRDGTAGTWLITPSVVGNDYIITVTGATGRTVDWFLMADVRSFAPGGQ